MCIRDSSKAWGMAGLRLGLAFASEEIAGLFGRVKYPYNINTLTQRAVAESVSYTHLDVYKRQAPRSKPRVHSSQSGSRDISTTTYTASPA